MGIPSGAHAADLEAFFKSHPVPYATEKLKQTLEGIRAKNSAALAQYFQKS